MDTPEDERTKLISCLGAFRQFWGTLPQVSTTHKRWPKDIVDRPDFCFLMTSSVSAGVPWAMCTVDCAVHSQSAQSKKDRISVRLSSDGCGDQPSNAQVRQANEHKLMLQRHKLQSTNYMCVDYVFLKDRVRSAHWLWEFGVGEDSVVGSDLQTDSEDYWRGGLQGVSLWSAHIGHSLLTNINILHLFTATNCVIDVFVLFRALETSWKQSWTKSRPSLQLSARPSYSSFWLPEKCAICSIFLLFFFFI